MPLSYLASTLTVVVIGTKPNDFVDDRATWVWMGPNDSFPKNELPAAILVVQNELGSATRLLRDLPKRARWNVYYNLTLSKVDRDKLFREIWSAPPAAITIVTNSNPAMCSPRICYQTAQEFVQGQCGAQQADTYYFVDKDVCSLPVMRYWFTQEVPLLQQYGSYYSARYTQISAKQFNIYTLHQIERFVAADAPLFCPSEAIIHLEDLTTDGPPASPGIDSLQQQFHNLEVKTVQLILSPHLFFKKNIGTSQCRSSSKNGFFFKKKSMV